VHPEQCLLTDNEKNCHVVSWLSDTAHVVAVDLLYVVVVSVLLRFLLHFITTQTYMNTSVL